MKSEPVNFVQIGRYLTSAHERITKANRVIPIDEQTGFQMAYDAMLRASLALLLSTGKRPRSTVGHHTVIIEEVAGMIGREYQALMQHFDVMRRKRNEALYEPLSTITEKEAHEAIETARAFLGIIRQEIQKKNPQQKLF